MSSNQSELSNPPTDAVSAVRYSSTPGSRKLLVSSWDRNVYLYDTHAEAGGQQLQKVEHRAPVLDVCFGADDNEAFSAGLDWDVSRINLATGEREVLSTHTAGVKSVVYSPQHKLLVSASWDSRLHLHVLSQPIPSPSPTAVLPLPAKPFSISLSASKLVVAMAQRILHIYDLASLTLMASTSSTSDGPADDQHRNELNPEPWQRRESSLKFMTRAVACMPDDAGYASSSIEGRVAVEWFDPSAESQARKYAFKCHRQTAPAEPNGSADTGEGGMVDVVYPVNALAFHPVHGTFASGGGDGVVTLWDGIAKRRIRQYPKHGASIAALSFSENGRSLAIGVSPGFEDGKEGGVGGESGEGPESVKVIVRELAENEAKGKGAK